MIRIEKPSLFDFGECLWFLDRNYDDCLHHISDDTIGKAVRIGGRSFVFRLYDSGSMLVAEIMAGDDSAETRALVHDYIVDWLDLKRDLGPFYALLREDPVLAYMAEAYRGLRLISIPHLYEALCWCVIGQQINLSFAHTLKRKLVAAFGETISVDGIAYQLFPRAEVLAGRSMQELKDLQYSRQKADYMLYLSDVFARGGLRVEDISACEGYDERLAMLTKLRGVGRWTANYVLMKTLKDLRAITHGDVGLLQALENHGIIKDRKDMDAQQALFTRYAGWESYLVFYLWRSLTVRSK